MPAQSNCRLDKDALKPLIQDGNPFFSRHSWDDSRKTERARLGEHRVVIVTQTGCIRHHIHLFYLLAPEAVQLRDSFWINETNALLSAIFWQNTDYAAFRSTFEEEFARKFRAYGLDRQFNFPALSRNFVCEIRYDPQRGAQIRVDIVQFLFAEDMAPIRDGIPREEDDGWFGQERKP